MPPRNPPYYAVKLQAGIVEAIGPVRINEHMEVLDKQDDPDTRVLCSRCHHQRLVRP